ncbi:MAG: hypothetical protein PVI90_09815 [Desulfobacteraceae bacterium]|jgi:hypothetical protein
MSSDLQVNWSWIVKFFENGRKRASYTFATVNSDGLPHVAPYASLVLNDNCSGFYSDVFPNQTSHNLLKNQRICILAINMSRWYFFKGLFVGRFDHWPGIRLYGVVDKSRKATDKELERWMKRVRPFKRLKGYSLLWGNVQTVRDIHFTHFEPVHLGPMTQHLTK